MQRHRMRGEDVEKRYLSASSEVSKALCFPIEELMVGSAGGKGMAHVDGANLGKLHHFQLLFTSAQPCRFSSVCIHVLRKHVSRVNGTEDVQKCTTMIVVP